jgi:YfiR/HmsC-like
MGTLRVRPNSIARYRSSTQCVCPRLTTLVLACVIAVWCMISDSQSLYAQMKSATEYQVKAAFLYNFAKFIDWPSSAFTDPKQPLDICVYGRDPFGPALEDALLGKTIGERRVSLGRAMQFQDLVGCHVVFVGPSAHESAADLANRLKGRAVLLVGESDGFAASGGTIQFTIEDNRVHFVINPDAADRAGLKISSKLLALAKIVRDPNRSVAGSALK